jgi:hypothetical protein
MNILSAREGLSWLAILLRAGQHVVAQRALSRRAEYGRTRAAL